MNPGIHKNKVKQKIEQAREYLKTRPNKKISVYVRNFDQTTINNLIKIKNEFGSDLVKQFTFGIGGHFEQNDLQKLHKEMKNEKNISMFEGTKFGISMDKFFEMGGGFQPVN